MRTFFFLGWEKRHVIEKTEEKAAAQMTNKKIQLSKHSRIQYEQNTAP